MYLQATIEIQNLLIPIVIIWENQFLLKRGYELFKKQSFAILINNYFNQSMYKLTSNNITYAHIIITRMDLDYLENGIENLDLKPEQIHNLAQFCITNSVNSELEIAKIIDNHFHKLKDPRLKTALFLLVSDILVISNLRKNKSFFKHLSPKLRPFIDALLGDGLENLELGGYIVASIDRWKTEQLFVDTFWEKMKNLASPIYNKLAEEKAGGGKHQKFTKYKKTFLMELMDVRKFEPTSKIYDAHVQMTDLYAKMSSFYQALGKIDFQNPNEDAINRAKELQRAADDYREKIQQIICAYHLSFKSLTTQCQYDYSKLQNKNE